MAWIESHTILIRHRKVINLAKRLRIPPVHALGVLHALWHAVLEQQEDGDLSSWSDDMIAHLAAAPGDAPQFVRHLQESGWLDGKVIHDWLDYAGRYLETKYRSKNPGKLVSILEKHSRTGVRPGSDPGRTTEKDTTVPDQTVPGLKRSGLKVAAVDSGGCGGGNGNDRDQNLQVQDLLDRVVEFTGSPQSRAFYQKAVSVLGVGLVEEAVGEARMRAPESRARYLTAVLTDWMEGRRVETR